MWQDRLQHILNHRYAYIGGLVAALLGLLAGIAMRPKLTPVEPPAPVAEVQGFTGPSEAAPSGPTAFTAYHKGVPDYVLGTDWTGSKPPPPPPPPPADHSVFEAEAPTPPEHAEAETVPEPTEAPDT